MSTNQDPDASESQVPDSYDDSTVDAVRDSLDANDYTGDELDAILRQESMRDDPRSTALEAIDAETEDGADETNEPDPPSPTPEAAVDDEAVAETMGESDHAVGGLVTITPATADAPAYIAGEWFDDGRGTRDVTYSRRVAEAVEAGKAAIVE